jgi:hypothetical protein
MGRMKISDGPQYKKTGSPLQKQQRRVQQVANRIFSERLFHAPQSTNLGRSSLELTREPEQQQRS